MSDLQLMVDVLNGSLKDAQHTMAELRADVEVRNQELAETQVIRAQLEGHVREAEHRLSEARNVIGLQREELAESRADRERITRTGAVLQNQLKQLRKQLSRSEKTAAGGIASTTMDFPGEKQPRSVPAGMSEAGSLDDLPENHRVRSQLDELMPGTDSVGQGVTLAQPVALATHTRVRIKYGDTLWSLAQRYHISVHQLMTINELATDYIQAGQSLWLPESVVDEPEYGQR
ncbi:MAG TPA: LysM peptidoglycan-binding domain-containing protein [Nitrospira sp.]|nr:LysM peptidoglycan-binding domain-containing protein [Nitrospira sp.]